jgi:putative Ig domain-containing protein/galactose oxidase-like protein/Kelch motif protein
MRSNLSYSQARLDGWNSKENEGTVALAHLKKHLLTLFLLCSLCLLSACGGGSVTPPPPPPPPPPPALQITSTAPPSGTLGVDYSAFALTASGGKSPYTWSWTPKTGESLPPGLAISNGTISGKPTQTGAYDLTITVTDSQSPAAQTSSPYTIWVYDPTKLSITSTPPDGTALAAYGSLHSVIIRGVRYSFVAFSLTASGGSGSYYFTGSGMPPGLSCCTHTFGGFPYGFTVHNIIWGKPSKPGTYQLSLTATDSNSSAQTTNKFTVNIHNPPAPTVNDALLPIGTVNSPYVGFTFTATNGMPPLQWSETGALPVGMNFAQDGSLSGTPTAAGSFPITVTAQDSVGQGSPPHNFTIQVLAKGFVPTGSMASPRVFHTATLLKSGKVLVVGSDPGSPAELYDPSTKTFSTTGATVTPRGSQAATLLSDGKVLIVGGIYGSILSSAEIYDPDTGTFTQTAGSMSLPRMSPTATLLQTGKVLITGGGTDDASNKSAELFDPDTGMFTRIDDMTDPRTGDTATLLKDGRVLIAGGYALTSALLYDPSTGKFSRTAGDMITWRFNHTATLLNDGRVLMAGGQGGDSNVPISQAEVYDPATGTFSAVGDMPFAREHQVATLLTSGKVLVAGGASGDSASIAISAAELFDPATGTFSRTADMSSPRMSFTSTLLDDGDVLVTGGYDNSGAPVATAELYQ